MKTTTLTILSIFLLLFSCREPVENTQGSLTLTDSNFIDIATVVGEPYGNFSDSLVMPGKMLLNKEHLIILDRKSKNPIHLIDLANDTYRGNFGKRGQGPGEITVAWNISSIGDDQFLLYDIGLRKVLAFNVDSLSTTSEPFLEKNVNQESVSTSICILGNDLYYTDDYNFQNRLFSTPLESELDSMIPEKGFGENPLLIDPEETDFVKADAAGAFMRQRHGIFAFAYKFAPRIDIFNLKENRWQTINTPEKFDIVYKSVKEGDIEIFAISNETRNAYLDVTVKDNHIYALYSKEKVLDHSYSQGTMIYVFDHSGRPVQKINLDQPILYFDVAEDESAIYGLKMDLLPEILKFKLN